MTQPVIPEPVPEPSTLAGGEGDASPPSPPSPPAAPPRPAGPAIVGVKALHDLSPDEPLTAAYKAGAIGFHTGERVPVRLADGALGTVPAGELPGVVDAGGELVHPTVLHRAAMEARYGGAGGTAGAAAAGVGRGLTVGLLDPLAVGAGRAVGGHEGGEKVRERLAAYQELHPIASTVGEVAGTLAPSLVSGGAAAGAEGAGLLARGGGALARGVRGAGAISEGVGALGRLAERGATRALARMGEKEGAGLARRMAEAAIAKGAGGAVDAGIYGAGGAISESTLHPDHELTAEKVLASVGHGAVLGSVLGGAVGAVGEAGKTAIAKASPFLRSQAEEQAVRALDARVRFTREMDKLPGGRKALGRDLLDAGMIAPMDTVHSIAPKLEALAETRFATIEAQVAPVADATVGLDEVLAPLEARARAFDRELGKEAAASAVRAQIQNIRRVFTPGGRRAMEELEALRPPELPAEPPGVNPALAGKETVHRIGLDPEAGLSEAAGKGRSPITIDRTRPGHIGEGVILDPRMTEGADIAPSPIAIAKDEAATAAARQAPIDANRAVRLEAHADALAAWEKKLAAHDARVASIQPENVRVTLGDLLAQRRKFEATVDWRTEGSVVTQGKKAVGRTLEDLVVDHGERAARARGAPEGFADAYKQAKLDWRRAKVASDAASDAVTRAESNAHHSLTDKIFAGHGAAAGFLAHGPVGALTGLAAGEVSHFARTRSRAFLATAFDKLSTLQAVARRSEAVDAEIAQGTKAFVERAKGESPRLRFKRVSRTRDEAREEYETAARELPAAAAANHAPPVAALAAHAPLVTGAFAARAGGLSAWLASQLPKPPPYGSPTPSDQEIHAFLQKKDAATRPVETILGGMARGDLTVAQADAVKATSPKLFAAIQKDLEGEVQKLLAKDQYLDFQTRRDLSLLFGVESDWSMTGAGIRALQAPPPAAEKKPSPGGSGGGGGGGPKRRAAAQTPEATELQTATERRQGGELR